MFTDSQPLATGPRGSSGSWMRPICERLLLALDRVRGDPERERLVTRAALRQAVTAFVRALRTEGISAPWVLESVVAFARGARPPRPGPRGQDPVEADVVRWSMAALEWPPAAKAIDVEVVAP
jgi:hypothetical protein